MEKFLIIDGHHLLFRSYAIPFKFFSNKGTPLHVVTTFLSLIRRSINLSRNVSGIVVVFDSQGVNTNSQLLSTYKSNRIKDFSNLTDSPFKHLPYIKIVLDTISVPWLEKDGYEADDVIASIASCILHSKADHVTIVSNDSDFYQLLSNDKISILKLVTKNNYRYLNKLWFLKEFGFSPTKYILYKSYVGDPTDNIKGINGIGKKRSRDIILGVKKYQLSMEEKSILSLNKKLITLDSSLDVDIDINSFFLDRIALSNKTIFEICDF